MFSNSWRHGQTDNSWAFGHLIATPGELPARRCDEHPPPLGPVAFKNGAMENQIRYRLEA
jgi:hypothetical protein